MVRFAPLAAERHGKKVLRRLGNYSFAASVDMVPIAGQELGNAASSMPIAFAERKGRYMPVGLMALVPGQNFFVGPRGEWLGRFIPAALRCYPFKLVNREGLADESVLSIDEDSARLADLGEEGEPLFEADGRISGMVKATANFLENLERSRKATDTAVASLLRAGVLSPWEIKTKTLAGEVAFHNLHRVDEVALSKVSDTVFLDLRSSSALALAYAQLLSLAQLEVLQRLVSYRAQLAASIQDQADVQNGVFSLTNEDSLHFG